MRPPRTASAGAAASFLEPRYARNFVQSVAASPPPPLLLPLEPPLLLPPPSPPPPHDMVSPAVHLELPPEQAIWKVDAEPPIESAPLQ
jgi:hypothetical protein